MSNILDHTENTQIQTPKVVDSNGWSITKRIKQSTYRITCIASYYLFVCRSRVCSALRERVQAATAGTSCKKLGNRLRRIENRPWGGGGLVIARVDVTNTTTPTGVRLVFAGWVVRSLGVIPACADSRRGITIPAPARGVPACVRRRSVSFKKEMKTPKTLTIRRRLHHYCAYHYYAYTCSAPPPQSCSRWAARPRMYCRTRRGRWCGAASGGSVRVRHHGRHHGKCDRRGCRGYYCGAACC